jgi:hypothetical protein
VFERIVLRTLGRGNNRARSQSGPVDLGQSIWASTQRWKPVWDNLSTLTQVTDPVVGSNPANVRKTSWDALNRATVQIDPLNTR